MKKILGALLLGIFLLPLTAAAQQWVEPYMRPDGTFLPGQWSTPQDGWKKYFSTPGTIDPFTGQFNPYGRKNPVSSSNPSPTPRGSNIVPGSSAPNPYAIPGSSPSKNALNPYAIPGSSPPKNVQNP